MLSSSEQPGPLKPKSVSDELATEPSPAPALVDALELAESLEPNDRMRLIATMWESLPQKNRAAFLAFGFENIRHPAEDKSPAASEHPIKPTGPTIWDALFDPANTSDLYSAPRRFDLATIFVVMAAYSILFGAMTGLDYYFGPVTKVAVGVLVTIVAASQALYEHTANPRGVSIVAGAVTQSVIVGVLGVFGHGWFGMPLFVVIVFYGLIGGAIAGYLAGVLVGGVFLVADVLRKRFVSQTDEPHDHEAKPDPDSADQGESPWTT